MTDVSIADGVRRDVDTCTGSGEAAPGLAPLLGLAAAPTFAIMALWSGVFGGQPTMLCMGMQNPSPFSEMALMYALMSAFHAGPWFKFISRRCG